MTIARTVTAWLKAARLPSQSYIALPLLLGQVMAFQSGAEWSWWVFALVQAFGLFDQLYIVFANDYADRDIDGQNETSTIFSGGSRVLVDGELTPRQLLVAAWVMAGLSVAVGVALGIGWGRWLPLPLIVFGLGLLWAYSYGPAKLSYRGGGELLQMLGVGLVLPMVGWTAQAGGTDEFPWQVLAFILPMSLATAICTALPDEPSDRESSKRTLAVLLGGPAARGLAILLNGVGMALFAGLGWSSIVALGGIDWSRTELLTLPAVGLGGQLVFSWFAKPGSRGILGFIFFGLLVNLSLIGGLVLDLALP